MIHIYIDGASRGNPGEAGIGIVIKTDKGETIFSAAGYAGKMTNNQAEYNALIAALTKLKKTPSLISRNASGSSTEIVIHSDSELVVKQLNGQYKVKENELKKLNNRVQDLIRLISANQTEKDKPGVNISFKHVRREQNREADRLANAGIDSKIPLSL